MIFDWKLNSGIVLGMEADTIIMVDEEGKEEGERPIWYFYLTVLTLVIIW